MRTEFIESLRRLFLNNKINSSKLEELKTNDVITENDYEYITSEKEVGE